MLSSAEMKLLALLLGLLALFAPAQAQDCELSDGVVRLFHSLASTARSLRRRVSLHTATHGRGRTRSADPCDGWCACAAVRR